MNSKFRPLGFAFLIAVSLAVIIHRSSVGFAQSIVFHSQFPEMMRLDTEQMIAREKAFASYAESEHLSRQQRVTLAAPLDADFVKTLRPDQIETYQRFLELKAKGRLVSIQLFLDAPTIEAVKFSDQQIEQLESIEDDFLRSLMQYQQVNDEKEAEKRRVLQSGFQQSLSDSQKEKWNAHVGDDFLICATLRPHLELLRKGTQTISGSLRAAFRRSDFTPMLFMLGGTKSAQPEIRLIALLGLLSDPGIQQTLKLTDEQKQALTDFMPLIGHVQQVHASRIVPRDGESFFEANSGLPDLQLNVVSDAEQQRIEQLKATLEPTQFERLLQVYRRFSLAAAAPESMIELHPDLGPFLELSQEQREGVKGLETVYQEVDGRELLFDARTKNMIFQDSFIATRPILTDEQRPIFLKFIESYPHEPPEK